VAHSQGTTRDFGFQTLDYHCRPQDKRLRANWGPSEIKALIALSAIRETLAEGVVNRFDTIFMQRPRKGPNGHMAMR
jgi:hypothetical protein